MLSSDIQKSSFVTMDIKEQRHTPWASDEWTFEFATLPFNVVDSIKVVKPRIARL